MQPCVLVVDDEEANRLTLERILVREDLRVVHAPDGRAALHQIREHRPDLVLTDLMMPGLDGMGLLKAARELDGDLEVIMMTAYGTVETAVEAMKLGATDFITKPLRRSDIVRAALKAIERRRLIAENRSLRHQLNPGAALIGHDPAMVALLNDARQVADSNATILVTGESGTGKGVLARWLHRHSPRAANELVEINCSALPENLLESELFGYEAGAFTDAKGRKEGRFDLANRGTLFLDEVTELPIGVQAKLLRVLQDGSYERLGGTQTLHSDARLIAATNRDPEIAVREGALREDLFYRLNVIQLRIPPLRDHREDIPLLARHFVDRFAVRHNRAVSGLTPRAMACLEAHHWPGNVRQLENTIERAVVLCKTDAIDAGDFPAEIAKGSSAPARLSFPVGTPLKTMERRMIEATIQKCNGDRQKTATLLGTTTRTLYRREAEWRSDG
ncbi:MAG: sigma-54 dependent transcriptional regulator [Myxococcota bacterium]|nr:sigma-54 dependent transcriptional regulator [Myxococcota bacterium]